MATLGQELREERERCSLTVKEISDRTKIGTRILLALESDRWELMPQKFFIKGVIKAYAQALGANPDVYLTKFDLQRQSAPEPSEKDRNGFVKKVRPVSDEDLFESAERPPRRFLIIVLIVLALALAAAAVYFFLIKPGSPPTPVQTTAPAVSTPAETPPPKEESKPAAQDPAPVAPGLKIELRFTADSWMHVTADGLVVMNGIQAGGTSAELRAEKELVLQTGNAGGFEFSLNGRPGRPLGGPGIVLTDLRINLDNASTFLKEEKPSSPEPDGR